MMDHIEKRGILILKYPDEEREIEFELNYLSSLSVRKRFQLMQQKSQEMITNLEKNGHPKTPQIIKRK